MATEIKLPTLGENLEGGEVLEIKIAAGSMVRKGQAILELGAEKATMDVPSPMDGKVTQVAVKKGDQVQVGQTLCEIEGDGSPQAAAPEAATPSSKGTPPPKPDKPSALEKTVPTAAPPPSPVPPPAAVKDGQPKAPGTPSLASAGELVVLAGPATRRLAREFGVNLQQVSGSGPGGRIVEEDIKSYVKQLAEAHTPVPRGGTAAPSPLPDFQRWGQVERRPLDMVRRRTAEHLSRAWNAIPHVTQYDLADITDLDAFRRQEEGKGPKLTITAFALKAAAIALKQFPQFNSSIDLAGGQLIVKQYYHIGVAVDTDRGLLVPVIRDVDRKSVHQLAQELTEIAERARQKKLQADEMRGGTFTISNLGGIGGTGFTPIINYPELAILGLSRGRLQPVVYNGQVVPRLVLPLSLSYDHRVIDGADGARFARRLAELLENPLKMLLHA